MSERDLVHTGIPGLDEILGGGLPANRLYLVQGDPGVGKTTLALHFLRTGAALGQTTLYVTLSETREELHAVASSHHWNLDGIAIHEMTGGDDDSSTDDENTLYSPAEVELGERMTALLREIDRVKPRRVVIDSVSELRLLAQTPLRFRRHILALKRGLVKRRCTVLLLENPLIEGGDVLLQSLVHGVIHIDQTAPMYGAERRRIRVIKLREVQFRGGYHDLTITNGGLTVFPRLVAAEHSSDFAADHAASGVAELDAMLGGGLARGTSSLFIGPSGSGKSALATRYAVAAAARGERADLFIFDEGRATLFQRSAALGMDLTPHVASGLIRVRQIDPAEMSAGEFAHVVRDAVETRNTRLVLIDSLNGFANAMAEDKALTIHLHELLTYLGQMGVVTLLVMVQHGTLGDAMMTPVDVSYLADAVILLRFFEAGGRVRKAVSVVKNRAGQHEDTIRALHLGVEGVSVGPQLREFRGVLTGVPEVTGGVASHDKRRDES